MKYTVYKTVNLVNGKYYFGVHKTENPNDDYLGSGVYIKRAVAKYGKENFRKEVLFIYLDPESAFGKEDELIQCYRGRDPLCMNLRKGGSGGFDWINKKSDQEWRKEAAQKTNQLIGVKRSSQVYLQADQQRRREHLQYTRTNTHIERVRQLGRLGKGTKHTDEAREKIRTAARKRIGILNNQFGTRWFNKGGIERKVRPQDVQLLLNTGWKPGRN